MHVWGGRLTRPSRAQLGRLPVAIELWLHSRYFPCATASRSPTCCRHIA